MSLKITNIVRVNGAACDHLEFTIDDNSTIRTKVITEARILELFDSFDEFPGKDRGALVAAWAIDRKKRGATTAQLINVEIESVIT